MPRRAREIRFLLRVKFPEKRQTGDPLLRIVHLSAERIKGSFDQRLPEPFGHFAVKFFEAMKRVAAVENNGPMLSLVRRPLWSAASQRRVLTPVRILPGSGTHHLILQSLRCFIVRLRLEPFPNRRSLAAGPVQKRALDCRHNRGQRAGRHVSVQKSGGIGVEPLCHRFGQAPSIHRARIAPDDWQSMRRSRRNQSAPLLSTLVRRLCLRSAHICRRVERDPRLRVPSLD